MSFINLKNEEDIYSHPFPFSSQNHIHQKHMKPTTRIAIAQLLASAGAVLTALANEFAGEPVSTEAAATPEPARRGRKPAAAAATPADPEPAAAETETATETSTNGATTGKTYEDMRALIEAPIKAGQGTEVKKVIAKYSQTGLKDMDPKHYKAFETDIIALSY